jgi:hypothetical protein
MLHSVCDHAIKYARKSADRGCWKRLHRGQHLARRHKRKEKIAVKRKQRLDSAADVH